MLHKTSTRSKSKKSSAPHSKIFVLDTNVLLHDPTSVYRFEENDVYLPMMTLEELDNNKKGLSEVARNARQVTRTLDEIVSSHTEAIGKGIPLASPSHSSTRRRLAHNNPTHRPKAAAPTQANLEIRDSNSPEKSAFVPFDGFACRICAASAF
mgnify:CR=1 FL=1